MHLLARHHLYLLALILALISFNAASAFADNRSGYQRRNFDERAGGLGRRSSVGGYTCPYPDSQAERQVRCQYITSTLSQLEGWQSSIDSSTDVEDVQHLIAAWEPIANDCMTSYRSHNDATHARCARLETIDSGCYEAASDFMRMVRRYSSLADDCSNYWSGYEAECMERATRYYARGLSDLGSELQSSIAQRLSNLRDEYMQVCTRSTDICNESSRYYGRGRHSWREGRYGRCSESWRNGHMRGVFGSDPYCEIEDPCTVADIDDGEDFDDHDDEDSHDDGCGDESDEIVDETETPFPDGTLTPFATPTPFGTPDTTVTPEITPTAFGTPTRTPLFTRTPQFTGTPVSTITATPTGTRSPFPTPTRTVVPTATRTFFPTPTVTPFFTRTGTPTPTRTVFMTPTTTPFFTQTATPTRTISPTVTPIFTPTNFPSATPTRVVTATPTTPPVGTFVPFSSSARAAASKLAAIAARPR